MVKNEYLLGYVKAGSYRKKILRSLDGKNLTPKELSQETDIPLSHVSNTLSELLNKNLILCLTPDLKKGRLYELTKGGKQILLKL